MRGIFSRPRADGGGKIAALVRRIAADERKAVAGYLLVVAVTASLYLLKPAAEMLFLGSDLASAQLPFKMPRLFGRKVAEYAFQCAVTFLFAAVMAAVDAFSLAAVKCAAHQFEAVSMLLEGMGGDESGAPPPEKALRDSVRLHQDALANARKLADLLNPLMFAHYTTSSANVCLVGYQIAVATDTSQVVAIVCHLVMLLARIFLLSYYSSQVIHQSVNVGHASYSCNWFSGSVDFKRMLTVVISRAQRPVVMRTGPFGVLSLETFATIMQGAYSYYTILKRLTSP
ncbi:odorant receptor 4-like [Bacillus rossius redtenbacheri]|uniref:odorant receptor 4-like n=1 Tax=Bacillus rossius redtenbacheri TaxID=93214 RepID=UPI002FDEA0EA